MGVREAKNRLVAAGYVVGAAQPPGDHFESSFGFVDSGQDLDPNTDQVYFLEVSPDFDLSDPRTVVILTPANDAVTMLGHLLTFDNTISVALVNGGNGASSRDFYIQVFLAQDEEP